MTNGSRPVGRSCAPWSGRFFAEEASGVLIRFEEEAHEFPKNFTVDPFRETIRWDYVKIGDGAYLLPVSQEIWGGWAKEGLYHVKTEYKNRRHLEAATSVTFH